MRQVCRGKVSNTIVKSSHTTKEEVSGRFFNETWNSFRQSRSQEGNIPVVFLWGKKVINLCVVEGTPFCGAAPEGWVTVKSLRA